MLLLTVAWSQTPTTESASQLAASIAMDVDLADGDDVFAAAQQALQKARSEPKKLRALFVVVNLQRRRGDFMDGLEGARDGLARARNLGDLRLQIDFLYMLGRIHWNLTQYPQSLESHLQELELAEKLGDPSVLARTHGGLGLTYYRFGRNADALYHFDRGLAFAREAKDERIRSSILNSLGNYYLEQQDYDQAQRIHEEVLKIRQSFGNPRAIADSFTNLGRIADARGDPARAYIYLQQALQTFEALKYRRYITNTHRRMARVLRKAGRLDEALEQAQTALRLAGSLESVEVLADIYEELASTHEARGEFAEALDFERKFEAARETMRNDRDRRHIDELRTAYRAEQRELEIALLKRDQELQQAEIRRRRFQNITVALSLSVGLILLGVVSFVQRARLRVERRIRVANEHARERAESAERLKSRLLQMASHDLKVPLTSLNATAALIGTTSGVSPEVQRLAAAIQTDTFRMRGLVRDFLDGAAREDGNLQLHQTEVDLSALVREAVELLQPVATQKEQQLICLPGPAPAPKVQADIDRLHQIFDNLIGNALKFTQAGGEITISVGELGGWGYVEVTDNGPGFGREEFTRILSSGSTAATTPPEEADSTGLGLFITRELLTLQGGRLEMQSKLGAGAVFRVLLPLVVTEPAA